MSEKNKTTLLDLFVSASKAALEHVDKTDLAEHDACSESFSVAGHDPVDFVQWRTYYCDERTRFLNLRGQVAPSAKIARQETAQA